MKFLASAFLLILILAPSYAYADQSVNGYYRKDGTYVQPYTRSSPNNTVTDNYSYTGNTNPNTGAVGTNNYSHDATSPYYSGPDSNGQVGHSGNDGYSNGYNNNSSRFGR